MTNMIKKLGRNDHCWCGSGRKYKTCHMAFDEKIERYALQGHIVPGHDIIKTPEQIEGIRQSSKLNIAILDEIARQIHIGMSTDEIDRIVVDMTKEMGGIAAPLGYEGFSRSVCTSINEVVCHGIPCPERLLQDGDIVNVDEIGRAHV